MGARSRVGEGKARRRVYLFMMLATCAQPDPTPSAVVRASPPAVRCPRLPAPAAACAAPLSPLPPRYVWLRDSTTTSPPSILVSFFFFSSRWFRFWFVRSPFLPSFPAPLLLVSPRPAPHGLRPFYLSAPPPSFAPSVLHSFHVYYEIRLPVLAPAPAPPLLYDL
ncbi:hypothetical protein DFH11DRAFT_1584890, partial [Phellopilus nigrolimitatus]